MITEGVFFSGIVTLDSGDVWGWICCYYSNVVRRSYLCEAGDSFLI